MPRTTKPRRTRTEKPDEVSMRDIIEMVKKGDRPSTVVKKPKREPVKLTKFDHALFHGTLAKSRIPVTRGFHFDGN